MLMMAKQVDWKAKLASTVIRAKCLREREMENESNGRQSNKKQKQTENGKGRGSQVFI